MTPESWSVIGRVYEAALERSEAERASFVRNACGGNELLRSEVESLLEAEQEAGGFLLANPAEDFFEDGSTKPPSLVGTRLHQYELLSLLGAGGMGEVYRALDTRLMRHAAVKVLPPAFAADKDCLRRFEHEAQAASSLNHPNIITIYETGETENRRFLAMEFVEGETLRDVVHLRPSIAAVTHMCLQVAEALKVAHAAQIVHRDIKPENLMRRPDGYIKVLDFGLARLVSPIVAADNEKPGSIATSKATRPGVIIGTTLYMSPEQARGANVSFASDVFSLGVVMYELSTGEHPFRGGTQFGTLDAILTQAPLPPSRITPGLPAAWEALVLWMLAKDPESRPSAASVQEALAEMVTEEQSYPNQNSLRKWKNTVGRTREKEKLKAFWTTAVEEHGMFCCVSGEAGIGKTTLVEDFLLELATTRRSRLVARGRCSDRFAGTEPYSPFLETLEDLYHCSESAAEVMRRTAPTWYKQLAVSKAAQPDGPIVERAYSQERFKRELASFLQELSRQQPLILFLEDLHWADLSTSDLLAFVAARIVDSRVLILATYRPSDLLLSNQSFWKIKQNLQASGIAEEIRLEFLSREEIEKYVRLEFPMHRLPSQVADVIHARTEGNPLFMTDLVRYFRDQQIVVREGEWWVLTLPLPEIARELPPSTRALIDRMVSQLELADRRLLVAASVQGQQFDSAVISRSLAMNEESVEERLHVLAIMHGFASPVQEHENPMKVLSLRYRFTHVLYQNALYGTLQPAQRASLSKAVAEALESLYGEQSTAVASILARLFEAGRRFLRAAEYYLTAAKSAGRIFAANEAAALSRQGLSMVGSIPQTSDRDDLELSLQLELGNALLVVYGYGAPEVEELYGRAHGLWRKVGMSPRLLPILYGLWVSSLVHGKIERALAFGMDFLDIAQEVQPQATLVGERMVGCPNFYLGNLEQARPHLQQAVSLYDPAQHRSLAWLYGQEPGMTAHSYLGWVMWLLGYPDQAAEHTRRSLEIGREVEHALSRCHSLFFAAVHAHFVRDWPQLRLLSDELLFYSEERKAAFWIDAAKIVSGLLVAKDGGGQAATQSMCRVLEALSAADMALCVPILQRFTAEAYAEFGEIDRALTAIDTGLSLTQRTQQNFYEAELYRFGGELLLLQSGDGGRREAEECFRKGLHLSRQQGAKSFELRCAVSLSRLWEGENRRSEALALLTPLCEWFTEGHETPDFKEGYLLINQLQSEAQELRNRLLL